jgi:hypothetical protein
MADKYPAKLTHLLLTGTAVTELYMSPKTGGPAFKFPPQNRQAHGTSLKTQLEQMKTEEISLNQQRAALGIDTGMGITLLFESEPGFIMKLESLESTRSGIELLAAKEIEGKTYATVFVPDGKLSHFINRVEKYLTEDTIKGKPKNQPLINSIAAIRRAALDALWTDEREEFPADNQAIWWEVWLRAGSDKAAILSSFKEHAVKIGLQIGSEHISFPDRTITLAYGTREQMSKSVDLLNCIAELRKAKETAEIFTRMSPHEQSEWVEDTLGRLQSPPQNAPAICILDTGINNGHPLIEPRLTPRDMHSYDPRWNVADHDGHGTEMAGLALYGDLISVLLSRGPIQLPYVLESVKILPPVGQNDQHLYGYVTAESIARAEITAPKRNRTACMAVTTRDFRDRGKPSSWSATVDNLCSGADDDTRRLFVISAGNTSENQRNHYPDCNLTDAVHDPGQSWNALTVGAFTEKTLVNQKEYPGWTPIAPSGDLSPSSCTSNTWARQWPFKPDIVLEGGNMALNPASNTAEPIDSLQLLSTYFEPLVKKFSTIGDTSAASALAARMAATIQAHYPDLWPETVRALLVHSADWTEAMKTRFTSSTPRNNVEGLLRYCGYGIPNLDAAMWSAGNSLTLIIQDSLQPFDRINGVPKTRDMHLHKLPWPEEALLELGGTMVEMKITLSYFIEPNPASVTI